MGWWVHGGAWMRVDECGCVPEPRLRLGPRLRLRLHLHLRLRLLSCLRPQPRAHSRSGEDVPSRVHPSPGARVLTPRRRRSYTSATSTTTSTTAASAIARQCQMKIVLTVDVQFGAVVGHQFVLLVETVLVLEKTHQVRVARHGRLR